MFARSNTLTIIMVVPTRARKSKDDHPRILVSTAEIRDETVECTAVRADALHLLVRETKATRPLDPEHPQEAFKEIHAALAGFPIRFTTEAAAPFDVEHELARLRHLRPQAACISVKEIALSPELASYVYGFCQNEDIAVQHILFDLADWQRLFAWRADGIAGNGQYDVIIVLGSYSPPRAVARYDLQALASIIAKVSGNFMVFAFGSFDHVVLGVAAFNSADFRFGFEENIQWSDSRHAESKAANAATNRAALTKARTEGISP